MSCPAWRPDCMTENVVNGVLGAGADAVAGMQTVAGGVSTVASTTVGLASGLGGFLPLVLIGLLLLFIWKLLGLGKTAAVAVADGYTGGQASRAANARQTAKQAVVRRSRDAGRRAAVNSQARRGPRPGVHTGQAPEVIARSNGPDGKPRTVTICAADPGAARAVLDRRFGTMWQPGGSVKTCPLGPASHYLFIALRPSHGPRRPAPQRRKGRRP